MGVVRPREHGASGPLIHQGPSKGVSDPRWRGWGWCLPPRWVGAGWGRGPHVFFREGGVRVVSGLVVRRTWRLGLLTK